MSNIVRIQGIGPTFAEKLVAAGIKTTEKLLVAVSSKKGPNSDRRGDWNNGEPYPRMGEPCGPFLNKGC